MTFGAWWLLWSGGALASSVGGLALALLMRRVDPKVPLLKTWLFYSGLLGFFVAVTLWVGLT